METALRHYDEPLPTCHPGILLADGPLLMGVLNVTPDSFSDGAAYAGLEEAVRVAQQMGNEGARFIDVGGESTRPGSDPVSLEEELERVVPVIKALAPTLPGRISVDTYKARVAAGALAAGAYMVNDISALRMDPEMVAVARDADCPVILMHMLGEPKTMQQDPVYGDVVEDVYAFFVERLNWAVDNGLKEENLLIDPGLGFGKTTAHNLALLRDLAAFRSLGRPIVFGASRKRFLGELLGIEEPRERDAATAATTVMAVAAGAHIVRVHRVGLNRDAAYLARAVFGPRADARQSTDGRL
jgi:dihydropteroate synthase